MSKMNTLVFVLVVALTKSLVGSFSVPTGACQDKVACDRYSPEICTEPQYFKWTTDNCPLYCGTCSQTTQGTHVGVGKLMDSDGGQPVCKDVISNCAEYGTELCGDVKFFNWANENCPKHCNRCSNDCKDEIANCVDYGSSVCTDLSYYNWVEMHCRKFCARCQP